jgi:hypothetical protein
LFLPTICEKTDKKLKICEKLTKNGENPTKTTSNIFSGNKEQKSVKNEQNGENEQKKKNIVLVF